MPGNAGRVRVGGARLLGDPGDAGPGTATLAAPVGKLTRSAGLATVGIGGFLATGSAVAAAAEDTGDDGIVAATAAAAAAEFE